ncbi:hypothetical protein PENTCL1PPCAC_20310, partial [Pristionchus entomophagus]
LEMPSYKLTYFDIRGLGEVARQLLHLSGTPFEDDRVHNDDWTSGAMRKESTPFGQLPVLEVDGQPMATSLAINRYLGKQFGFAGKTPFEEALVDALGDQWMDYFEEVKPFLLTSQGLWPGEVTEEQRQRAADGIAKHLPLFEQFAKDHGTFGHLVGTSLTWIDLLMTDHFRSLLAYFPDALNGYPALSGVRRVMGQHPKLREWRNAHDQPF